MTGMVSWGNSKGWTCSTPVVSRAGSSVVESDVASVGVVAASTSVGVVDDVDGAAQAVKANPTSMNSGISRWVRGGQGETWEERECMAETPWWSEVRVTPGGGPASSDARPVDLRILR
jgi:hypothetical protein